MNKTSRTGLYLILIVLCVIGIITGSFWDLPMSKALYIGDALAFKLISFITVIVFFESCVVFLGVLFRQLLAKYKSTSRRVIVCLVFSYLFCSTAVLGGAKINNDPLLAGSFSNLAGTLTGSLLMGSFFLMAGFIFGFFINGNQYDSAKTKVLIKLILIFTMGFLIAHYLNCIIDRPSYLRLVAEGDVTGFMPWFRLPKGTKLLMSLTDLISSHQGSFVSSHVLYAALFIIIFPAYSLVIPSLKKYERLLIIIAGVFTVMVILCRLLSGNNYLTDISFAALYSFKFSMSYNGIRLKRR